MKKYGLLGLLTILVLSILLVYKDKKDYLTTPPSETWGKEVYLSKGKIKENVKIIRFKENYVVAHNDGDNLKVILTDKSGKALKENYLNINEFMNYTSLTTNEKDITLSFVKTDHGENTLVDITLNDNLEEVERNLTKGVNSIQTVDNSILILSYKDKIEIRNKKNSKVITETVKNEIITGHKEKDGSYVVCYGQDGKYYSFKVLEETIIDRKEIGAISFGRDGALISIASNSDENYLYLIIENSFRGGYGTVSLISYDKSKSTSEVKELEVPGHEFLYNPISIENSGDKAEFIIGTERPGMDTSKPQYDFINITLNGSEILDYKFVTRTIKASEKPGVVGDTMVFGDVEDEDYNIYMTSREEEFKNLNNKNRPEELNEALKYGMAAIIRTFVWVPITSAYWLIPSLIPVGILSFFLMDGKNEKKRKLLFLFSYLILIILKLKKSYDVAFGVFNYKIPNVINNPLILLGVLLTISLICMYISYKEYEKDTERIAIGIFILYAILDTVLSVLVYFPYIL